MQQSDSNGNLLGGARLHLFDGGTTTPRIAYRDLALSSEHPNPIIADSAGRLPLIYLDDGYYRQRLTTSTGGLIFDDDGIPVLTTSAGGAGTSVDPESVFKTGNLKIDYGDGVIDGYVRVNGRTIGSAASGATERANADTEPLYTKLWSFANIVVPAGKGANAAADFAANKVLTLPNCAGRGIWGADDLGAGPAGNLTALTVTNPTLIGSPGGAQTFTLTQSHIPAYTLTGGTVGSITVDGTTSAESANHTHNVSGATSGVNNNHTHTYNAPSASYTVAGGAGAGFAVTIGAAVTSNESQDHSHTFNVTSGGVSANHSHTVTATGTGSSVSISSGGSGSAFSKVPPIMTFMIYLRL